MKHETKSYMNDVLNELSSIKEFLEQKKIITKNGIQFPKNLDEAKNIIFPKNIKINNFTLQKYKKTIHPKFNEENIYNQLNNNLNQLYQRYTNKNGFKNNNYNPYQKTKENVNTPKKPIEVSGTKITPQTNPAKTQYGKYR